MVPVRNGDCIHVPVVRAGWRCRARRAHQRHAWSRRVGRGSYDCAATRRQRITGAAAGIALINSLGNLGGFFGPWWIGIMKDATGSFAGGLYGLALLSFISAVVCWLFLKSSRSAV